MIEALKTYFLVIFVAWVWCVVIWGWPGNPFELIAKAQDAAPAAPAPPIPTNHDLAVILQHYERIFQSWAQHANLTLIAGVGVVWIICWMAIRLTRIHVENPRQIHHHYYGEERGHEIEQKMTTPLQIEPMHEKVRAKLPAPR